MSNKKIFEEELMSDDELDNVVGGNAEETFADSDELCKRGLLSESDRYDYDKVAEILHKMGYTGYKIVDSYSLGEGACKNIYTDKSGNIISRATFWKNFDS